MLRCCLLQWHALDYGIDRLSESPTSSCRTERVTVNAAASVHNDVLTEIADDHRHESRMDAGGRDSKASPLRTASAKRCRHSHVLFLRHDDRAVWGREED